MAVKKYNPTSPGRRFMSVSAFEEVTTTTPERSLLAPLKKSGGRNVHGRITVRHIGGGHKRKYRLIDFKRNKDGIPAKVATIEYDPGLLPRKNIPILKLTPEEERSGEATVEAIRKKLEWFRVEGELMPVAVAFEGPKSPKFSDVQALASALTEGLAPVLRLGHPFISVTEKDVAKVLGQTVRTLMPQGRNFICIDAVTVAGGDYIDIGAPAADGAVLPVVVKTLLFK